MADSMPWNYPVARGEGIPRHVKGEGGSRGRLSDPDRRDFGSLSVTVVLILATRPRLGVFLQAVCRVL